MIEFIYKRISVGLFTKTDLIPKRHYFHIISLKYKIIKNLYGVLYIDIDGADLEKKRNQFINDISDFNNKHIIQ